MKEHKIDYFDETAEFCRMTYEFDVDRNFCSY